MGLLDFLTGKSKNDKIKALLDGGAKVIDVRSPGEYSSGHVKGSINIPLNEIGSRTEELKNHSGHVLGCASGMRSGSASSTLASKGLNCVNGGPWTKVQRIISAS
jgi:rhodanese-related sulfurtransferase